MTPAPPNEDIVARARALVAVFTLGRSRRIEDDLLARVLLGECADEIDRLRREVAALQGERDFFRAEVDVQLRAKEQALTDRNTARAEVAAMQGALEEIIEHAFEGVAFRCEEIARQALSSLREGKA